MLRFPHWSQSSRGASGPAYTGTDVQVRVDHQATEGCGYIQLSVRTDGPETRALPETMHQCLAGAC